MLKLTEAVPPLFAASMRMNSPPGSEWYGSARSGGTAPPADWLWRLAEMSSAASTYESAAGTSGALGWCHRRGSRAVRSAAPYRDPGLACRRQYGRPPR
jgi:hypothetical protein